MDTGPRSTISVQNDHIHIFYRQLDFSSEPGVDNEILENEPESWLTVAKFYGWFLYDLSEISCFERKSPIWGWTVAEELLNFWPKSQAED